MFEQSNSEKGSANRHNPNRSQILKHQLDVIDSENARKVKEERKRQRLEEQGNDRFAIIEGSNDRFNRVKYNNPYNEETDKYKSYKYGYYIHGGRRLIGSGMSMCDDEALKDEELDEETRKEIVDMYIKTGALKKEYEYYIDKLENIGTLLRESNISTDQLEPKVTFYLERIKYLQTLLEESNKDKPKNR